MTYKKPSPAESVLKHLIEEVGIYRLDAGARLPTTNEVAVRLGVSQGTVKNVYRRFAEEGKIQMRKGDGTFWQGSAHSARSNYVIGVDREVLQPAVESAPRVRWTYLFIGGLMTEKLSETRNIQLQSCGHLQWDSHGTLLNQDAFAGLDGVLLMQTNPYPISSGHLLIQGKAVPIISLNPQQEDSYRNHVSPDYFAASYKLGSVWRSVGKKRVLALMSPSAKNSITVRLRYGGLMAGLCPGSPGAPEVRLRETASGAAVLGYEAVTQLLDREGWIPDAVYGAGDHLAFGAIQALEERGISVPKETSVVGGNGADCLAQPPIVLTSVEHGLERLGRMMLRLILQRIERDGEDAAAYIEPSRFIIGTTTTAEENKQLTLLNQHL